MTERRNKTENEKEPVKQPAETTAKQDKQSAEMEAKQEGQSAEVEAKQEGQPAETEAKQEGQPAETETKQEKQPAETAVRQEKRSAETAVKQKRRSRRAKDPRRSRRHRRLLRSVLLGLLCLFVLTGLAGYLILKPEYERYKTIAYEKLAGMSRDDFSFLPDTEIFDKDGARIGLINAGHYEYVPISEININLQNAYIAQEDRRFASHHGVDWIATIRAGLEFVRHGGKITQGGSTITQQVIKNTFLTQEQTFPRKITEILMAPELEKKYTKADIMEFYCNTNFYGNRCYGVQAASQYYFGKDAADLSVPEAATLVGVSNSPSRYDPVRHPEECKEKRNRVLDSMYEEGFLSENEYKAYLEAPLVIVQKEQEGTTENYLSSYALHCAARTLMQLDHFDFQYIFDSKEDYDSYMESYNQAYEDKMNLLRQGGYQIYTSLDQSIQQTAQAAVDSVLAGFTELQENGKYALQGASVVVDNQTGYVVAIVGGRGTEDGLNRAYYSALQPGSTIKPLLDYGPAFDTGEYYPARIVNDHKWEDGPSNSSGTYAGDVTVRQALNQSLNTVAWQVLEDIGIDYGLSYLAKMQFQKLSYVDNAVPSISIGGFTNGVRVVDMAKGYAALADGGVYSDRTCIVRISHEQLGDVTGELKEERTQVYLPDTAWMLTDILKGNFTEGTARGLGLANGMPAAGKTGTTNESRQTWFCGYTRYYSTAVWVGYDLPRPMPGVYGATYAGKIWKQIMDPLSEGKELLDWEKPESVEQRTEENGTTDWRSNTDELRAEASLHEKEQAALMSEVQGLLTAYEQQTIASMEDTRTVAEQYETLMNKASLLDDSPEKSEILTRTADQKEKNDQILAGMTEAIARWEEQESEAEAEAQKERESRAEEEREEAQKNVNRQEVQNAIDGLNALEYWPDNMSELVNDAIAKMDLISGYPDEEQYESELNDAIARLKALPSEAEWQAQEAAKAAREQAESAAAAEHTAAGKQALSNSFVQAQQGRRPSELLPGAGGPGEAFPGA